MSIVNDYALLSDVLPVVLKKIFEKTIEFINDVINSKVVVYDIVSDLMSFITKMNIMYKTFEKIYMSKLVDKTYATKIETKIPSEIRKLMDYICCDLLQICRLDKCISFLVWFAAREIAENVDKKLKVLKEVRKFEETTRELKELKLY